MRAAATLRPARRLRRFAGYALVAVRADRMAERDFGVGFQICCHTHPLATLIPYFIARTTHRSE
jgi:hypothetical protein